MVEGAGIRFIFTDSGSRPNNIKVKDVQIHFKLTLLERTTSAQFLLDFKYSRCI
jgi:hypothetical protein